MLKCTYCPMATLAGGLMSTEMLFPFTVETVFTSKVYGLRYWREVNWNVARVTTFVPAGVTRMSQMMTMYHTGTVTNAACSEGLKLYQEATIQVVFNNPLSKRLKNGTFYALKF